jgi:hypothetical protein
MKTNKAGAIGKAVKHGAKRERERGTNTNRNQEDFLLAHSFNVPPSLFTFFFAAAQPVFHLPGVVRPSLSLASRHIGIARRRNKNGKEEAQRNLHEARRNE